MIKERLKKLKEDIPVLFLCLKDSDTLVLAKILAAITVGYALSPIDLIPDFIPVFGFLDDVLILPALVVVTSKIIPKDIWEKNREQAKNFYDKGLPKKWYYAIPIVIIWVLLVWWVIKLISKGDKIGVHFNSHS